MNDGTKGKEREMKKKAALLVVLGVVAVAFQAWGADSKSGGKVDVTKLTCKEVMAGSDMDRAVNAGFFLGFLAAKKNSTVVDLDASSAHTNRVLDYCLSNPTSAVMDAFTKTGK